MNKPTRPDDLVNHPNLGLTKREYFAAQIMQGLVVRCIAGSHNLNDKHEAEFKAEMAVNLAEALIETLNKEKAGQ